jgi:hypothetical protein
MVSQAKKAMMMNKCTSTVGHFDGQEVAFEQCTQHCPMEEIQTLLETTVRRHWATTHYVLPQRLPGQQSTTQ